MGTGCLLKFRIFPPGKGDGDKIGEDDDHPDRREEMTGLQGIQHRDDTAKDQQAESPAFEAEEADDGQDIVGQQQRKENEITDADMLDAVQRTPAHLKNEGCVDEERQETQAINDRRSGQPRVGLRKISPGRRMRGTCGRGASRSSRDIFRTDFALMGRGEDGSSSTAVGWPQWGQTGSGGWVMVLQLGHCIVNRNLINRTDPSEYNRNRISE